MREKTEVRIHAMGLRRASLSVGLLSIFCISACNQQQELAELRKENETLRQQQERTSPSGQDKESKIPGTEKRAGTGPLVISAEQYLNDYLGNEVAADGKYKGKRLRISGVPVFVGRCYFGTLCVTFGGGQDFSNIVMVLFDDKYSSVVANLKSGTPASLSGLGMGSNGQQKYLIEYRPK